MFRQLCGLVVVAGVVFGSVACGGGDSKTNNLPDGGRVTTSKNLPSDFPDDFPTYDGADLQGSAQGEQNGIQGTVVTWETGDDFDDVKKFYDDAFKNGPWKSQASGTIADSSYWSVQKGDKAGYVNVSKGDKTAIVVVIGPASGGLLDTPEPDATQPSSSSNTPSSGGTATDLPAEASLSADFPKDKIPLPSDARVTSASSVAVSGVKTFILELYSTHSVDDLSKFFADQFAAKGWTQVLQTNSNGEAFASYSQSADGSQGSATITISKSDVAGYSIVAMQVTNV